MREVGYVVTALVAGLLAVVALFLLSILSIPCYPLIVWWMYRKMKEILVKKQGKNVYKFKDLTE